MKCEHSSAGKRLGTGGAKIGNVHLKWAFSEAAALFLRNNPEGQQYARRQAGSVSLPRAERCRCLVQAPRAWNPYSKQSQSGGGTTHSQPTPAPKADVTGRHCRLTTGGLIGARLRASLLLKCLRCCGWLSASIQVTAFARPLKKFGDAIGRVGSQIARF